jgi:hypothetical protein
LQRFGQIGRGGEVDPVPGGDSGPGEPNGDHGLAGAGLSDQQDVAGVVEEAQRGQFADEFLIHPGLRAEVEILDPVGRRQAGESQQPGVSTCLGCGDLDGEQPLHRRDQ